MAEEGRVRAPWLVLKIAAIIVLLAVFNILPRCFGIVLSLSGEHFRVVTPFDAGIRLPVAMLNLWWMLALAQNLALLWQGRWSATARRTELGLGVFGAWILWSILSENAGVFGRGVQPPGVDNRAVGILLGRVVQSVLAIGLVLAIVRSVRRYRRLMGDDEGPRSDRTSKTRHRERPWGEFERTLRRDLKDVYDFYLDQDTRARLARMGTVSKGLHLAFWLLKAMYLKLTPVRRVLFLIALLVPTVSVGVGSSVVRFTGLGFLILLLILLLELKDKLVALDELAVGRAVQVALLPTKNPAVAGWDVWLYTRPANEVGGDLVDYIEIGEGRWGLALGDVAGKGLGAALLMSKLQATLRALAPSFDSLSELGGEVNRIICRDGLRDRFASMVYVELSPESGRLRVLNAGHLPPLIRRGDSLQEMPRGAPAFGIVPGAAYLEQRVQLDAGELLVVYSDGLSEATSSGGEFFGDHRFSGILMGLGNLTTEEMGARLLSEVEEFIGGAPPSDDLSLVLLKRVH